MKFLFVGLGSIGERHLRNLYALGERDFLAFRTRREVSPVELQCNVQRVGSFEEGLAAGPDAVFVTNPTVFHVPFALEAVKSGCHVFVEKPLSSSLNGVAELAGEAARRARVVYTGYHLRFHPILRAIRTLLAEGTLGTPLSAHLAVGQYLPDWHPGEYYRAGYAARRELGGGVILTLSHEIDYALWLFGRARSVFCLGGKKSTLELDVEDVADALVQFESGCVVHIHLDCLARPPRRGLRVLCERGMIEWDYFSDRAEVWRLELAEEPETIMLDRGFDKNTMYLDEAAHFLRTIRGEEEPVVPLTDGIAALKLALAAHTSMESGENVIVV